MTGDLQLVQCLLCHGSLPAVKDDIFYGHMQEQHRAYFNLDFMFSAFFLNEEGIDKTLNFIENVDSAKVTLDFDDQKLGPTEAQNSIETNLEEDVGNFENTENEKGERQSIKAEEKGEEEIKKAEKQKTSGSKIEKETKNVKTIDEATKVIKKFEAKIHQSLKDKLKSSESYKPKKKKSKKDKKNKSNVCSECGKVFDNIYYMSTHMRFTHDYEIKICDLCDKKCQGAAMLGLHKRRFHKAKETCEECGKTVKKLRVHMATMHTKNEDKNFRCNECGKGFVIKSRLAEHSLIHLDRDKKPFPCKWEGCNWSFTSNGNRMKHQQKHIKTESFDLSQMTEKTNKLQVATTVIDDKIGTTAGSKKTADYMDPTLNNSL